MEWNLQCVDGVAHVLEKKQTNWKKWNKTSSETGFYVFYDTTNTQIDNKKNASFTPEATVFEL